MTRNKLHKRNKDTKFCTLYWTHHWSS